MTDPNSGNFKKGPAMEIHKESPAKQQLSRKAMQKGSFQGGPCRRATLKEVSAREQLSRMTLKSVVSKKGSKKGQHSRKALQKGPLQGRSS
jgi:hypothetical protein